jgi:hypothetical protein
MATVDGATGSSLAQGFHVPSRMLVEVKFTTFEIIRQTTNRGSPFSIESGELAHLTKLDLSIGQQAGQSVHLLTARTELVQ